MAAKRPANDGSSLTAQPSEQRHRDDIQGLRAVAVLLVALSHAGVRFLRGGFVGVDVFFVLSGFLITGLLLAEARRRRFVSLLDFYMRRTRRILPAAILTLLVTDFAAYHLLNFVRAKQYLQDSIASALFAANIHFAGQGTDYFARAQPPSPLQHFWSLAVEEQFYVVWPLLFILVLGLALRRSAPRPNRISTTRVRRGLVLVAAITVASFAWSAYDTSHTPAAAYFSTFTRAWELGLGAALALAASNRGELPERWRAALGWGGLAAIAVAAVTFSSATSFPGYAALLPTLGAGLVIVAGLGSMDSRISVPRLLAVRPMRYVGDRSYAFYLWHWPVLVIAAQRAGHSLSLPTNLLLLLGTFALSTVSYRLFENPIRKAQWTRKPEFLLVAAASVVGVLVLATTYVASINDRETRQALQAQEAAVPSLAAPAPPVRTAGRTVVATAGRSSEALSAVINAVGLASRNAPLPPVRFPAIGQLLDDQYGPPAGCAASEGQATSQICKLGTTTSLRTLTVIGDSHAEMWMPAILDLASREHWAVVPFLKTSCKPRQWLTSLGNADCHAWFRWALRQASALHPDVSLISGAYSYAATDPPLLDAMTTAIRTVKPHSRRVIVIADVPWRDKQPVDCLLTKHANMGTCEYSPTLDQEQLTNDVAQTAASNGGGFIDPTGWFCYADHCPLVVSGLITYLDDNHISRTYSAALAATFRSAFDLAIKPATPSRRATGS